MSQDVIETFLNAPTEQRLAIARNPDNTTALQAYLGEAAYDDYRRLADKLDQAHLGVQAPKNLIFIPGIMGSLLLSKTKGGIWWIDARTRQHIDDLRLAPDGRQDADPNNQIMPVTTDPTYEPFLTAVLARDDFGHEVFAYDWRKPPRLSTHALKDLILKLYTENGNLPVHLVAHSMGGLMIRATLMEHGDVLWPKLGRIVFIGTPHYGSTAMAGYLKNHLWGFELMALLGLYLSRETFRSFWGALSLLPAPRGTYPGTCAGDPAPWRPEEANDPYLHPCVNFDLYQAVHWKLDLTPAQTAQLQAVLDGAAEFHRRMAEAHQAMDQSRRERMLVIAGVGYKTLFRIAYGLHFFGLWKHTAKITQRIPGDPHREGDGRVPLASAALENIPIRYVKGVHGGLPNIPAVYSDVFRWLNEQHLQLPDNTFEALSGHLAPDEGKSEAPHLDGTAGVAPFGDDPGLWNLDAPDPVAMEAIKAKLETGQLPEFSRVRIL